MLRLPERWVRSWARAGLVPGRRGQRGELRFSFHDLVLLRAASGLIAAQVPARRVRRALARLRQQLPEGHSLAAVRISAAGDRVVVRDGRTAWMADSGQALLDFGVSDLAQRVRPLLERAAMTAPSLTAGGWYDWGCDLEDGAPEQAKDAYRRALDLDPSHAGSHLNLGRLLHESGDAAAAENHYRRALETRPTDAIAWFNLGVALEDRGRAEEALTAYGRALAIDADLVDAHHNAARLCERLGRRTEALRHLGAYRRLLRR